MQEPLDFDFLLWQMLHRSVAAVTKARKKELDQCGLTLRQAAVLRISLRLGNQATPTELAKQLFLEIHTISEQLTRMEKEGLIKKIKDLDRKNRVRVEVTPGGYELYRKSLIRKPLKYILAALTEDEKKEFYLMLSKLRGRAVKKLGIKDTDFYPPADYTEILP